MSTPSEDAADQLTAWTYWRRTVAIPAEKPSLGPLPLHTTGDVPFQRRADNTSLAAGLTMPGGEQTGPAETKRVRALADEDGEADN
jgi:hypothetical protein